MFIERLVEALRGLGAKVGVVHAPRGKTVTDLILAVDLDGAKARFLVQYKPRAPYPSEVSRLSAHRPRAKSAGTPLLLAPYVSEGQGNALVEHGWSWADTQGNFDLRAGPLRLRQRSGKAKPPPRSGSLPRGAGGLAVVRALIYGPTGFQDQRLGQQRLAAAAGVSQPRVAQVLAQLRAGGLVTGSGRSWEPRREALLDAFLDEYRGPGGQEEYFYSLDPLTEVAWRVATREPDESGVVSADVGPDLLVPVRAPTHLIVYLSRSPDLSKLELTAAEGRADANVIIRWPTDRSVLGPEGWIMVRPSRNRKLRLAHPTQLMWDLRWLGGDDRLEAAEELKNWILSSP